MYVILPFCKHKSSLLRFDASLKKDRKLKDLSVTILLQNQ